MRARSSGIALTALLAGPACTNGYDDLTIVAGSAVSGSGAMSGATGGDGSGGIAEGGRGAGGERATGGKGGDGGTGGVTCGETVTGPGIAGARESMRDKTIDGVLDDWGCAAPLVLDGMSAGHFHTPDRSPPQVSAAFHVEWDASWLYIAAVVEDPTPGEGNSATEPFKNDSIEIYVAGANAPQADYSALDHHFIVDYKNVAFEYSPPLVDFTVSPAGLDTATKAGASGYTVETRMEATLFGSGSPWGSGRTLGLDLMLNDGKNQATYVIWVIAGHGACGACTPASCCCTDGGAPGELPSCNTLVFGSLQLL